MTRIVLDPFVPISEWLGDNEAAIRIIRYQPCTPLLKVEAESRALLSRQIDAVCAAGGDWTTEAHPE